MEFERFPNAIPFLEEREVLRKMKEKKFWETDDWTCLLSNKQKLMQNLPENATNSSYKQALFSVYNIFSDNSSWKCYFSFLLYLN